MAEAGVGTDRVQLPEVLVEKIMAGIPFPHILKARQLSREWKSKFSKVVSQLKAPINWPEYFPAFLSNKGSRVEGYDSVLNCEKNVERVCTEAGDWDVRVTGGGTLLVVINLNIKTGQPTATVVNLLTRQRRDIVYPIRSPERPDRFYSYSWPILVFLGSDDYELIIWFWDVEKPSFQRKHTNFIMYNSRSGTWIEKSYPNDCIKDSYYGAYKDGSVYFILHKPERDLPRIVQFNLRSGARTETAPIEPDDSMFGDWVHCVVVRCDWRIMAVMFEHDGYSLKVKVLQLDTDSFELVQLSEASLCTTRNLPLSFYYITVVASSTCIYILQLDKPILTTYNVSSNTWNSNTSIPDKFCNLEVRRNVFVFEPGLNPFAIP